MTRHEKAITTYIHLVPRVCGHDTGTVCSGYGDYSCGKQILRGYTYYTPAKEYHTYWDKKCENCAGFFLSRYSFVVIDRPTEATLAAKAGFDKEWQDKLMA